MNRKQLNKFKRDEAEKKKFELKLKENQEHVFWNGQPMLNIQQQKKNKEYGPIIVATVDGVPSQPMKLPKGYEWHDIDVNSDSEMTSLYDFLEKNYIEDSENTFRFAYPIVFLKWALCPPAWKKILHISVRAFNKKKNKYHFVGFISGIPCRLNVNGNNIKMIEVNFLCVHKILRGKKLAQILIQEITRRTNLQNVWQAIYTVGKIVPSPMAKTKYFHRSLNPTKLLNIGFSQIPNQFRHKKNGRERTIKYFRFPSKFKFQKFAKFRPFCNDDVEVVTKMLNKYLTKFKIHLIFSKEEVAHWFIPRKNVISSFVIERNSDSRILSFISYYHLPSTILNSKKYKQLNAAYLFYYCSNINLNESIESSNDTKVNLDDLINRTCKEAKKEGFDVFNCLNIHDNMKFINVLKFHVGDGTLYYYLYNYKTPTFHSEDLGITML